MMDWFDDHDIDVRIKAFGIAEVKDQLPNYDVILLAPQMRYAYEDIASATDKPIRPIPPEHYQMNDVEFVCNLAMKD